MQKNAQPINGPRGSKDCALKILFSKPQRATLHAYQSILMFVMTAKPWNDSGARSFAAMEGVARGVIRLVSESPATLLVLGTTGRFKEDMVTVTAMLAAEMMVHGKEKEEVVKNLYAVLRELSYVDSWCNALSKKLQKNPQDDDDDDGDDDDESTVQEKESS